MDIKSTTILNNGVKMPCFVPGTFSAEAGGAVERAVITAKKTVAAVSIL